jgi:hypothetical protein
MNVKLLISKLLVLSKSATFVLVAMFFMVPSNILAAGDLVSQFTLHNPPGFGNNIQCTLHNPPGFGNSIQFRLYNPPGFGPK